MQQDEIDKIIEDAVAGSKKQSKWHRSGKNYGIQRARSILNALFLLGFAVAVIIYILNWNNPDKTLFFCVGFGAMALKIIEFILRFMF